METKEGEIQFVKEDRKSFTIQGEWFNNKFKKLPIEFIKGSNAKVNYIKKGEINYWQSIELNEPSNKEVITELKKCTETPKETINTLIMCMKDIYLSSNDEELEKIAERLIKGYKKIKENV